MRRDYNNGFDSAFATDADYEDGFTASDKTISEVAGNAGITHDEAKNRLGIREADEDAKGSSVMDQLRKANDRFDDNEQRPKPAPSMMDRLRAVNDRSDEEERGAGPGLDDGYGY